MLMIKFRYRELLNYHQKKHFTNQRNDFLFDVHIRSHIKVNKEDIMRFDPRSVA